MNEENQNAMNIVPSEDTPLTGDFRDMAEQFVRLLREDEESEARARELNVARAAEEDRVRAERARAGELGPEWRTVQARIDLGQTTVAAVFSGQDTSAEAEALRALSVKNLTTLRDAWAAEGEDDENVVPTPDEVFEKTLQESRERFDQAAARIADALRDLERLDGGAGR